ncbi:hypothetical protein OsI_20340 [Oryza sativa Indica Group]|uniref:DUF3615 domain-containing protein n=1 Tax=Oryza sativa subsp. indica TaxID=39946 RepID=B8AZA2_ORYSI|nr:hypothetical protein OsI_20340 [Oryza sativa Indica Group]
MGGFQFLEAPSDRSDSSVSSLVPTSPAPARLMARDTTKSREPRVNPQVRLAQAKRFAEGALEHYNRRKKDKFELVDAVPCIGIPEPHCIYTHINFTARSSKKGSQELLFFAELYHCQRRQEVFTARLSKKGSRGEPSNAGRSLVQRGFVVTCCEPLGPDSMVGRKLLERDDTKVVRKNTDFTYCYGCPQMISHPKGEMYIAGHCNIPHVYEDHLRVLKSRGVRRELDYKKGNITAKRFKISRFYEFCNVNQINDDGVPCGLDQHNVKGTINNFLSKTMMIASFPVSYNCYDFEDRFEHVYQYDINDPVCENDGTDRIITQAAVIYWLRV